MNAKELRQTVITMGIANSMTQRSVISTDRINELTHLTAPEVYRTKKWYESVRLEIARGVAEILNGR